MGLLERATADGLDGNPNDGTFGVTFVSNHDEFAPPPAKDNIAYAHILTRPGYPIVYFNALEFGTGRNFPLRGRGDALGGEFGETIKSLSLSITDTSAGLSSCATPTMTPTSMSVTKR
jgi:hypothetical protein